jgi:16S rRNA (cytidine1402-2'-O)-methyltransferase
MRIPALLERLEAGQQIALVTDAGVPGVSDPGVDLVRASIEAGIVVDPIPGATAPITAAVASGFPMDPLTIFGFPPNRAVARSEWLRHVASTVGTVSFFEAPHRIRVTLTELADISGERPICVGRELTKVHQEFLRGTPRIVLAQLGEPRGEFTVVIGPAPETSEQPIALNDADVAREFGELTETSGFRRRDAIAAIAKKIGRSTRDVYAAVERAKHASE